jgi:ubiquitin-like modifier-activating enzyme ATG7
MVSVLQHPRGNKASAPQPTGGVVPEREPPDHALGLVPHQIRGFLAAFQNLIIRGEAYPSCSACSPSILKAYRDDGWNFVKRALMEKDYVTELSGLAEVQRQAEKMTADLEWSDDEGVEEGDGELI